VKRWLLLALAVGLLALALSRLDRGVPEHAGGPPMDQVDEASREKLRELLRESREP
jgi:hypothetical protein